MPGTFYKPSRQLLETLCQINVLLQVRRYCLNGVLEDRTDEAEAKRKKCLLCYHDKSTTYLEDACTPSCNGESSIKRWLEVRGHENSEIPCAFCSADRCIIMKREWNSRTLTTWKVNTFIGVEWECLGF